MTALHTTSRFSITILSIIASLGMLCASAPQARAQPMTARAMLEQQDQWTQWADQERKLQLTARFEGRSSRNFRVYRLPIVFVPARNGELPQRMQSGQRLNISGRLRQSGNEFEFHISRLDIQQTDRDWLADQVLTVPDDKPELLYPLADEFALIAEFYSDQQLMSDVRDLRQTAFRRQRRQFAQSSTELWTLADHGQKLDIDQRTLTAIRFQSLNLRRRKGQTTGDDFLRDLRTTLVGWDKPAPVVDASLAQQFQQSPVTVYERSDDATRRLLHRLFYRQIRLPVLKKQLRTDGSNGLVVAGQIKEELPEELATISEFEQNFVDYKLAGVQQLTRTQLTELVSLLQQYNRTDEVKPTIGKWLTAVETQFRDRGLQGVLRTAEEYLFAAEEWNNLRHRDQGIEFLKQAWQLASEVAPQDAVLIGQRLERLGWVRLNDRWMTEKQMQALPKSDIELAMREGRVVKGMLPDQVVSTLGEPARIVRVASSRHVQEIWVFQTTGASGISIQLRRTTKQDPSEAVVVQVSQLAATPISQK
jgi:hypothetical protein